jgi:hypothetical protein
MEYRSDVIEVIAARIDEPGQLSDRFSDRTSGEEITDSYALGLFNLSNVMKLFENLKIGETIYILPEALVLLALGSPTTSPET